MSHSFRMYLRLLRYVRPYKGKLVISTLAMIGVAAMTAVSALIIKNVLDDVFIAGDRQMLLLIPAVIIAIYILKGIFRYVRTYVMSWGRTPYGPGHQKRTLRTYAPYVLVLLH